MLYTLEHDGYLAARADGYHFVSGLLEDWWRARHSAHFTPIAKPLIEMEGDLMKVATKKYNPGFLSDDELTDSFCVRTSEFESIVETLHESNGNSNRHMIVIGPRGLGKTHLLLRVAVEIRRNAGLAELFPIVFAEESYEVGSCGEFWLESLNRLSQQAPNDERSNLRLTYEDLRTVSDDRILADRCLGTLLDFADCHGQRLVLLVENLNMLFADMIDKDAGWRLRKTLQTEPRIILLGSATNRFNEIDHPEHALYDLFRVITLHPLDTRRMQSALADDIRVTLPHHRSDHWKFSPEAAPDLS